MSVLGGFLYGSRQPATPRTVAYRARTARPEGVGLAGTDADHLRFIEPCLPSPPTRLSLGPRIARSKHDTLYEAATAVGFEFPAR
jgi:hypothetical protein